MKAKIVVMASALGAAVFAFAAERVDVSQLPAAVKKSLDAAALGDPVKQITVRTMNGKTVYDIELERKNAINPRVRIAADGTVLRDTNREAAGSDLPIYTDGIAAVPVMPSLKLDELPASAQATINKEAAGRTIAKINRDTIDGRSAYAVQFKESGRNPWVYVADDGTLLRPTEKPPALGLGTTFSDTPAKVQQTIRDELGAGEILKIDKDRHRGEPDTYKVEARDSRGTFRLRISEDGRILENSRASERPKKRG